LEYPPSVRHGRITLSAGLLAIALLAGACGSSSTPSSPPSAVPPTINASSTPQFRNGVLTLGGWALYVFQPDADQRATCKDSCAVAWPPVLLSRAQQPTAGPGVQASLLGTDPYSSTQSVVTYKGWPLYTYVNDLTAGVAAGQGTNLNGGYWYVIRPDGTPIVPPGDPSAS
jgi:predicted lipoprotein with Yx(FWY)xxD motif